MQSGGSEHDVGGTEVTEMLSDKTRCCKGPLSHVIIQILDPDADWNRLINPPGAQEKV